MLPVVSGVNGDNLGLHSERERVWSGPTCVVPTLLVPFLGTGATAEPYVSLIKEVPLTATPPRGDKESLRHRVAVSVIYLREVR